MKFKATPTPEQSASLENAIAPVRDFLARRQTAQQDADLLQTRLGSLKNEESTVAARMTTAEGRETSRSIAIELAAIRIEIEEVGRQLVEAEQARALDPKTVGKLLADSSEMLAEVTQEFPDQAIASFVAATKSFFTRPGVAEQVARESDLYKTAIRFRAQFQMLPANVESGLDRLSLFLDLTDRIQAKSPLLEFSAAA